ncbi:hypothetical protein CP532_1992 [Ophiocordyceps camponoti-leonardi (nom. inval.)]|nr:hypothetical protein CP532_1992 [Ophiocordyceps camponoti-leonardi (nom. inval.)]
MASAHSNECALSEVRRTTRSAIANLSTYGAWPKCPKKGAKPSTKPTELAVTDWATAAVRALWPIHSRLPRSSPWFRSRHPPPSEAAPPRYDDDDDDFGYDDDVAGIAQPPRPLPPPSRR